MRRQANPHRLLRHSGKHLASASGGSSTDADAASLPIDEAQEEGEEEEEEEEPLDALTAQKEVSTDLQGGEGSEAKAEEEEEAYSDNDKSGSGGLTDSFEGAKQHTTRSEGAERASVGKRRR